MPLNGDQEFFEKGDDVCFIMTEVSIGEGLDWQHIRNEFYKAMSESFGEVTKIIVYLVGRRSSYISQASARAKRWKLPLS